MSEYSSLKATINANIKANNNHEITGAITNSVLNAMVDSLGAGYQFMGVATPTNPGTAQTPDYKCFYLATTPGTYTYLGGLVVADGEVALLKYDSSWTKEVSGIATAESVSQLGQEVYIKTDNVTNSGASADWAVLDYNFTEGFKYTIEVQGQISGMQLYDGSWHAVSGVTYPKRWTTFEYTSEYTASKVQFYAFAGTKIIVTNYSKIWDNLNKDAAGLESITNHLYNVTERNNDTGYSGIATAAAAITSTERYPGMIVIFRLDGQNFKWKAYLFSSRDTSDTYFLNANYWKDISVTLDDFGEYPRFAAKTIFNVSENQTKTNYTSLSSAAQDVALTYRQQGMMLLYASSNIDWHLAMYNSTNIGNDNFYNEANWIVIPTPIDNGVRHIKIGADYDLNEFKKIQTYSSTGESLDTKTWFNSPNVVRRINLSDIINTTAHPISKMYIGFECRIEGDIYDSSIVNDEGVGSTKLCPCFAAKVGNVYEFRVGFKASPLVNAENPFVNNEVIPAISSGVEFACANANFYGSMAKYDDNEMPLLKLNDSFAIRWIGATSTDVKMKSESGALTIYTSSDTLYSFSYSTYTTIKALVGAINEVSDLSAKILSDGNTSSIHDFTDIYLLKDVSLTNTSDTVVSTSRYNAYVIVKSSCTDKWHKVEIVKDTDVNDNWYVFVDGVSLMQYSAAPTKDLNSAFEFYFGGKGTGTNLSYSTRNYDIRINDLLDVELHTKNLGTAGASPNTNGAFLMSKEHKYVLCLFGHGIAESGSMTKPLSYYEEAFKKLKDAGYTGIDIRQLQDFANGNTENVPNRSFAVIYDDSRYEGVVDNEIMAMHSRFGVYPSNAVIPESAPFVYDGVTYQYLDLDDYSNVIRQFPIGHTNTCLTQETYADLITFFEGYQAYGRELHFNSQLYVVAYGKTNIAIKNLQKLCGIALSFNTSGVQGYVMPALNKYSIQRVHFERGELYPIDGYII